MKKEFVILFGLVLAAGCAPEDREGADVDAGVQEESFVGIDADSNGLISEEEASLHEGLANNFDQADANSSGYVSRNEFEQALGSQTIQE